MSWTPTLPGQDNIICHLQIPWVPPQFYLWFSTANISKPCCLNKSNSRRYLTSSLAHQDLAKQLGMFKGKIPILSNLTFLDISWFWIPCSPPTLHGKKIKQWPQRPQRSSLQKHLGLTKNELTDADLWTWHVCICTCMSIYICKYTCIWLYV